LEIEVFFLLKFMDLTLSIVHTRHREYKNEKKTRGSIFNFIGILVCRSVSSSSISLEIFVLDFFFFAFHLIEKLNKKRERKRVKGKKLVTSFASSFVPLNHVNIFYRQKELGRRDCNVYRLFLLFFVFFCISMCS